MDNSRSRWFLAVAAWLGSAGALVACGTPAPETPKPASAPAQTQANPESAAKPAQRPEVSESFSCDFQASLPLEEGEVHSYTYCVDKNAAVLDEKNLPLAELESGDKLILQNLHMQLAAPSAPVIDVGGAAPQASGVESGARLTYSVAHLNKDSKMTQLVSGSGWPLGWGGRDDSNYWMAPLNMRVSCRSVPQCDSGNPARDE